MSASICPLISIQGESGCPLLVSISHRNAGFWIMSFSVYGRLYLASTARTPALQPQYVFRYAVISGVCISGIYHNFGSCNVEAVRINVAAPVLQVLDFLSQV